MKTSAVVKTPNLSVNNAQFMEKTTLKEKKSAENEKIFNKLVNCE